MQRTAVTYSIPALHKQAEQIADKLALPLCPQINALFSRYLIVTPTYLGLQKIGPKPSKPIYVDFLQGPMAKRLRSMCREKPLIGRAVGTLKPGLRILDITAGFGRDASVLAKMGFCVRMLESSPIVAALLEDGLKRAMKKHCFKAQSLQLIPIDAVSYLEQLPAANYPDIIYLDPLFPASKKSAAVKKDMTLLREIASNSHSTTQLLTLAKRIAKKRVVLKRHRLAPKLEITPDIIFSGQRCRFDVYLKKP